MDKLIKALQILRKYGNPEYPTHCEHDILYVAGIKANLVNDADTKELIKLGFFVDADVECFASFEFGSC